MTNSQVYNLMALPIALVCLIISLRAFYMYRLTRSDMLFILGLAMATICAGTCVGVISELHIANSQFQPEWARTFCAAGGGSFIFLSSLVRSHEQIQQLKRAQIIVAALCGIVILLTPLYPPVPNTQVAIALACVRMIIYSGALFRYVFLYTRKATRFSLVMSIAFLVLVIGYAFNLPGILDNQFAYFSMIAASIRICAYLTLLVAYSMG